MTIPGWLLLACTAINAAGIIVDVIKLLRVAQTPRACTPNRADTMNANEAFPLSWPIGWHRSFRVPSRARFGLKGQGTTLYVARSRIQDELRRLGATAVVISSNVPVRNDGLPYSNVREPSDHGVAVYCQIKGEPRVLACDKWDRVSDNLVALSLHVEAIRGQLRWGVGSVEQAFGGYKALPAVPNWSDVLGVSPGAEWSEIERKRLELLERHHPDRGGDSARAAEVNQAFSEARAARGPR